MTRTFDQIPRERPDTPLLDSIALPADLRRLPPEALEEVVDELREYLLYSVGQSGGHFGAGLGVVELTVALHYVYDTPHDRLLWDVGHQAYPHKILTGRRERMMRIRHKSGPAAFPCREESDYDTFGVGHSSTSISAALGMAIAARMQGSGRKVVAVIGDGAMTAGMAFEALAHAGHLHEDLLVILNDNDMSISPSVGGLANYFARIWASKLYISLREGGKRVLSAMPQTKDLLRRTEESMKGLVSPGALFESLGFNYIGPMSGHHLESLVETISTLREAKGPQLLHLRTQKGKGFLPAEQDPVGYHAITKLEPMPVTPAPVAAKKAKYADVFGDWLCDTAAQDSRLVGITPAMCEGSGMVRFAGEFPQRYHDVAIAEQHALTLAAGLACEGEKPVVAIYSTFLQRAYDQLIHDIALQKLDVTFGIDRAGLVGEDGPTHHGVFDFAYLRTVPHMVIAAPSDENECRLLLNTCYEHKGPAAVRYPRGTGTGTVIEKDWRTVPLGRGVVRRESSSDVSQRVVMLAFGSRVAAALQAAAILDASVVDMRFVKPLDIELVQRMAHLHALVVTVEEHALPGGAGSAVNECLVAANISTPVLNLAVPDQFIAHGSHAELLAECGLDADGIVRAVQQRLSLAQLRCEVVGVR